MLSDTWNIVGLFQPFDGGISRHQATADANRYVLTWGTDKAQAWRNGNAAISEGYYLPYDTDMDVGDFGNLGHPLGWWKQKRPDWVLYQCDRQTPAWVPGLPHNVPLDISNPAVAAYQMGAVVPYMRTNGYTSLTVDVISLTNGQGGCGVWTANHTRWVSKFTGQQADPAWLAATLNWAAYAQWYLHRLRPQFPVLINTPGWIPEGDPDEESLIQRTDGFQDEAGFTGWGNHLVNEATFLNKVWWAEYVQGLGKAYLVSDLWQGAEPNPAQRDFAASTYLMAKEHQAALVTAQYGRYGVEHFWPEFESPIGSPCGPMDSEQGIYVRKYKGALVLFNPTTAGVSFALPRPRGQYADIEGRKLSDPLKVLTDDGYVLLTSNGCG